MSTRVSVVFHYEDGKWWADAPDVPDYVAGADTLDELRVRVKEGLEFHLERRVEVVEITAFDFVVTNSADAIQLSRSPHSRSGHVLLDLTPAGRITNLGGSERALTPYAGEAAEEAVAS